MQQQQQQSVVVGGLQTNPYPPPQAAAPSTASFPCGQALFLGIMQLLIGVLCIFFNGITLGLGDMFSIGCVGIWGGILFIVAGSLGVAASRTQLSCLITGFNVMSIISASLCLVLLIVSSIGAAVANNDHPNNNYGNYGTNYNGYNYYSSSNYQYRYVNLVFQTQVAMEGLLAFLAILEAIFAIWSSAICCKAVCCCNNIMAIQPQTVWTTPTQPMVTVISQQQQSGQQGYSAPPQNYHQQGATMYPNYPAAQYGRGGFAPAG